ncbi:hypothetical protein EI94DRAFT_1759449 [Lactarius quietus]|nr:hypothetical protein EI94DRAFT_1759449 [Lactarius quietus]
MPFGALTLPCCLVCRHTKSLALLPYLQLRVVMSLYLTTLTTLWGTVEYHIDSLQSYTAWSFAFSCSLRPLPFHFHDTAPC